MSEKPTITPEERIRLPKIVVWLTCGQLLAKLLLIDWYRAEYTDAILQLNLFENGITFYPPLFPALARLIEIFAVDPVFAGRLVSILASSLTTIPVHYLGKRLWSERTGVIAAFCYSVSAIHWRWSIRAMTDPLFTLFFVLAVLTFAEGGIGRSRRFVWWSLLWSGLAVLTRYQGLILVPLVIFAWRRSREEAGTQWIAGLSVLPWTLLIGWLVYRGVGHTGQFQERATGGVGNVFMAYLTMSEGFLIYLPYALTYPLFVAVLVGLERGRKMPKGQFFGWATLYLFVPWLIIHSAFQSFQFRYFLPFVPLFAVWGGIGVSRLEKGLVRNATMALILIWGAIFSIAVLGNQRGTFGDIRATAEYIRELDVGEGRIFSDEVYRPGVDNVKMEFWSGGKLVHPLPNIHLLKPGDYVVLHNTYTDLNAMADRLHSKFRLNRIYKATETIRPLLPDIMVTPPITSQPGCMAYRYFPQHFLSVILHIDEQIAE